MSPSQRIAKLLALFLLVLALLVGCSPSVVQGSQPVGGTLGVPTPTAARSGEAGGPSLVTLTPLETTSLGSRASPTVQGGVAVASLEESIRPTVPSGAMLSSPESVRYVIIISIDGLRPDALIQANAPNLDHIWQNGAYSWQAQTVSPSVTLPAHASMVSGLDVSKHRVDWNDYRPELGYIQVPTIFSLAKARGLGSAMFVQKDKLRHLAPPGTVDTLEVVWGTVSIAERAARYFVQNRPAILFVHFAQPDSAGHAYGWMSRQQLEVIEEVDKGIGRMMEILAANGFFDSSGISREMMVMVSADHGGHDKVHGTRDSRDMTIPWIAYGAGIKGGYQVQQAVRVYDIAATALEALGIPAPVEWDGKAIREAFKVSPRIESKSPVLSGAGAGAGR